MTPVPCTGIFFLTTVIEFMNTVWSCRESNPGPDKAIESFLHAYSFIVFRSELGERQPTFTLSRCIFSFLTTSGQEPALHDEVPVAGGSTWPAGN